VTFVRLEEQDGTAVLTLCRPPVNAMDLRLLAELNAHLARLESAPPARGLVITGDGRMFSAGYDVKASAHYTVSEIRRAVTGVNEMATRLYGLPTATVAAVNGHAIGGGFILLLACDARVAVESDAKLGLPEVALGIPYPACALELVRAEIEPSLRRRVLLAGEITSPMAAHARGVVDELVAPNAVLPRAIELARERAALPGYIRVKRQLKGDLHERMRAIVATESDPMLA
jgi:enoyl-CoA hydratase